MDNPYDRDDHISKPEDIAILCLIYLFLLLALMAVDLPRQHSGTAPAMAILTEPAIGGEHRRVPTTAGVKPPPALGTGSDNTRLDILEPQHRELRCRNRATGPNARYCAIKR